MKALKKVLLKEIQEISNAGIESGEAYTGLDIGTESDFKIISIQRSFA